MDTLAIFIEFWDQLDWLGRAIAVFLAIHPVASAIVVLTPTPKDDAVLKKFYQYIIEPLALYKTSTKRDRKP